MNVALPEFDGRIVSVPVSFKESVDGVIRYVPDLERVRRCAGLTARLARRPPPPPAVRLRAAPRDDGYGLGDGALPGDGDALMQRLLAGGGYDREYLPAG